ncbi:MAG: winged helix-turn-helix domain-containing protein [Collinsella sp.]
MPLSPLPVADAEHCCRPTPDMDGVKVGMESVRAWSGMPSLWSRRSEDADKIRALDAGADDYLTKPFSVEERSRVLHDAQAPFVCAGWHGCVRGSFDTGELHIDFDAGIATMDGEELHLTPIEYKLLCLLAHNADKVLTHQFILHEIWGTATKSDLASLRVFMGTLRKKIESDPAHPRYIQTHGHRLPTGHLLMPTTIYELR